MLALAVEALHLLDRLAASYFTFTKPLQRVDDLLPELALPAAGPAEVGVAGVLRPGRIK